MSHRWDKNRRALEESDRLAELAVLRTAADEAARHVRMLYFTFLLFAFYVAVIVFSTTDEQLLKETGAKLPLLNVELPLLGFYIFIPWLVLVFHAHLLNQFYLLSRKLFNLDNKLRSLPPEVERTQRELPFPLIFSHLIIGRHYPGLIRWAFKVAVVFIILLTPILVLVAIQWMFLRYHDGWITFDHQLVLTLDLLLLWIFWPLLSSRSGHWQVHQRWRVGGVLVLTILLLFGSWGLLVPPGGGIERLIGYQPWPDRIRRNLKLRDQVLMRKEPPVELLFAEHVVKDDKEKEKRQAEIWLEAGEALDLSGRDLRYADFSKSNLWDADLRGARLQHANLDGTKLQGADLGRLEQDGDIQWTALQHANLRGAQLQRANLREARLQNAQLGWLRLQDGSLQPADLQGADLRGAKLQRAKLERARLQDANLGMLKLQDGSFQPTNLQGADLQWAKLQNADLSGAVLQGAVLWGAALQGADLQWADLQIADLRGAALQIADLRQAQLQGAVLMGAALQGADLQEAALQGADLSRAELQGADLRDAVVYGTSFQDAELSLADLRDLRSPRDEWKGLSSVFSEVERLETRLEKEGEHWSQEGRERVEWAIERFWSIAFDLPSNPTAISPLQGFDVMHDWQGLFADWPAPPKKAEFEQAHVKYRAELRAKLACTDRYIAKRMRRQAKPKLGRGDPVLAEALRARAESGECPELAEVLKEGQ
ncbi:pentapeptide repeat-containing protein [Candidatus Thiosymbion oneisti]|uniref:pentapeptide repeat-containing protein n=1 Tax=Candidatus Thiosymbion oneisti TaxID=589554 RepID=UPI000B7CE597|nr:pentapeptide repeat-containing protein [Candidatus Thiosymbion oneisti]